jgi:cobalt transporter subunit CbtB
LRRSAAERIDRSAAASYTKAVLVPRARCGKGIKREYGADYPSGAKTGTAPATVSGKFSSHATDRKIGKAAKATKMPRVRRPANTIPGAKPMLHMHTEGVAMTTATQTAGIAGLTISQRLIAGGLAFLIGITLLFGVGFASDMALHNGAHDTRHSMGFPCH